MLDLGCGVGDSIDMFRALDKDFQWFGVDIEDSPEVRNRLRSNEDISVFDGVHLPYEDAFFDVVYTCQVFEHVRYPDKLMSEVQRVLKPRGVLVGSVSYLEPYHSRSIFNFTPYGIYQVLDEAGLALVELRPGADAFILLVRQLMGLPYWFSYFMRHSALYFCFEVAGSFLRLSKKEINFLKLQFCGHLGFIAHKPEISPQITSHREEGF